jgi:hypothetical protein
MLITVYKVLYPGLEQVTQYYRWNVTIPENEDRPRERGESGRWRYADSEIACPGCGANLRRWTVYNPHHCPGTLTANPVEPMRQPARRVSTREQREQRFREYQQRNRNVIVTGSDCDEPLEIDNR